MIDARSKIPAGLMARDFPLLHRSAVRETVTSPPPADSPAPMSSSSLRGIADEMLRKVTERLPGRIRDLQIRIDADRFVLAGVATSYHVKQVAQHVAMNALDAAMLGQLVNEIEVRSVR